VSRCCRDRSSCESDASWRWMLVVVTRGSVVCLCPAGRRRVGCRYVYMLEDAGGCRSWCIVVVVEGIFISPLQLSANWVGGELAPARRMFGGQGWHGQGQRAVAPWGLGRYGISDGGDRTALPIRIENEHGGKGAEMQQQRQPFLGGEGRCYTPYRPLEAPTGRRAAA
jgi:hypothetical protein